MTQLQLISRDYLSQRFLFLAFKICPYFLWLSECRLGRLYLYDLSRGTRCIDRISVEFFCQLSNGKTGSVFSWNHFLMSLLPWNFPAQPQQTVLLCEMRIFLQLAEEILFADILCGLVQASEQYNLRHSSLYLMVKELLLTDGQNEIGTLIIPWNCVCMETKLLS